MALRVLNVAAMAKSRPGFLRPTWQYRSIVISRKRNAGRVSPSDPLMQAPTPRAVGLSEPAILDGAGGGNRTHTPCGTGF